MRMRRAVLFWCVVLGVLVAAAQAKCVQLSHSFRAGEIDKYKLTMDMRVAMSGVPQAAGKPMNIKMTSIVKQKVLGTLPDGSGKVLVSLGSTKVSSGWFAGTPVLSAEASSVVMTVAKDGRLIAMDGSNTGQMFAGMPGMDLTQLTGQIGYYGVFPQQPVELGQSWRTDIPLPYESGTMSVVSKLIGTAVPVGKDTACKIKQEYKGFLDLGALAQAVAKLQGQSVGGTQVNGGMIMSGWTVIYFSHTRGKLLKANGNVKADFSVDMPAVAVSKGAPQSMTMKMDIDISIAKV